MFSANMQRLYKRWLIFGLLLMCLGFFGFSDISQIASASNAPCYQECADNQFNCFDSCMTSCDEDSTDQECTSCKLSCENTYWNCVSVAVYCNMSPAYTPQCQFYSGQHCPIINGTANCDHPDTHYGYYQLCDTIGGNQCVACPNHDYCQGSGGQPPC